VPPTRHPTAYPTRFPTKFPTKQPTKGATERDYVYVPKRLSWKEANNYCQAKGYSGLATVTSKEENLLVRKKVPRWANVWIGASDHDKEGTFVWADGSGAVTYTNWSPGEPNENGDEDCVVLYRNGRWNDGNCGLRNRFVCNAAPPAARVPTSLTPTPVPTPAPKVPFIYRSEQLPWPKAAAACERMGTSLATITSLQQNKEVSSILGWSDAWIGLNDRVNEGNWVWDTGLGNTPVTFKAWGPGEPNDFGFGRGEDCAIIHANGRWNDLKCFYKKPYVCNAIPHENSKYVFIDSQKSWWEAALYCKEMGSHLAVIQNKDQNDEFVNIMKEKRQSVWIGLSDVLAEGSFSWVDGKTDFDSNTFSNWAAGQPDNNPGGNADCVDVNFPSGQWMDDQCEIRKPFACMRNQPVKPSTITFFKQGLTFEQAEAYCRSNCSTLVTISNEEQEKEAAILARAHGAPHVWIGLSKDDANGYRWNDGTVFDRYSYDAWPPREHWKVNDEEERRCVQMVSSGMWQHQGCQKLSPFMCQPSAELAKTCTKHAPPSFAAPTPAPSFCTRRQIGEYPDVSDQPVGMDRYLYVAAPMRWGQAQAYCRSIGSDLATIRNFSDNDFAHEMAAHCETAIWIGLSEFYTAEGEFAWADGSGNTSALGFEAWAKGEPNDASTGEDCVALMADGFWNDALCHQAKPFICDNIEFIPHSSSSIVVGPDGPNAHDPSAATANSEAIQADAGDSSAGATIPVVVTVSCVAVIAAGVGFFFLYKRLQKKYVDLEKTIEFEMNDVRQPEPMPSGLGPGVLGSSSDKTLSPTSPSTEVANMLSSGKQYSEL